MIGLLFFCTAMDILANCRAMLPTEPLAIQGEIVLRNRKGIPSGEYDYTVCADRTKTPAKLSFEFREHGTTNVLERLELLRPGPVPEGRVLKTTSSGGRRRNTRRSARARPFTGRSAT